MVAPSKNKISQQDGFSILARRSQDDADEHRSLDEQDSAGRRYGTEKKLGPHVRTFRERGSGVDGFKRDVLNEIVAVAERGELGRYLVVFDVSRFARCDVDERGYWLTRLRRAGVEVRYVADDAKLSGEAGPIMGAVLQASAYDQSKKIGLRVAMGISAAVERGTWTGGMAPYGFRLDRSPAWQGKGRRDTRLEIVESEAVFVRRMAEAYLSGRGGNAIAGLLNGEGVRTRSGCLWTAGRVKLMLSAPLYVGDQILNQRRSGRPLGTSKFYHASGVGAPVRAGEERVPVVHRDAFPAILSRETWDAVQRVRAERAHAPMGGTPGLLSGFARCGSCGGPLNQMHSGGDLRRGRQGRPYYYCSRSRQRGNRESYGACGPVRVRGDRLEAAVLAAVRAEVARLDASSLADELRATVPAVPAVDVARLEAQRRRLAIRRRELVLSESDTFERAALADLAAEDARLAREIERAKGEQAQALDVDSLVKFALDAASKLDAAHDDERAALREILRLFVPRLVVESAPKGQPKPVEVEVVSAATVALAGVRGPPSAVCRRAGSARGRAR